jgi:hypothetical protein
MADRVVDPRFAPRMRDLLRERNMSFRALGARTFYAKSHLHALAAGVKQPTVEAAARIDEALGAGGELVGYVVERAVDELAALELAQRVAATDVSAETLDRLERAVDELAMVYPRTPPAELLVRVRQHVAYVRQLLERRKTLDQHRRLLVVGGWLELLAATVHIDLAQPGVAETELATAAQMADHTGHAEITAWCVETRAWQVLTDGDYGLAAELSRQAQQIAPRGSSAFIQATAQEGRACARMGQRRATLDALNRTTKLASPLPRPDQPEHHYRYDPGKAAAYTATTLSWLGDPAAEDCARDVVRQMDTGGEDGVVRPRRAASARLDLALALLAVNKPDEAAAVATDAVTSGLIVASNWWRVTEVLTGLAPISAATELREACLAFQPS